MKTNTNADVLKAAFDITAAAVEALPTPIMAFILRLGIVCFMGFAVGLVFVEQGNRLPQVQWVVFFFVTIVGAALPLNHVILHGSARLIAVTASAIVIISAPWVLPTVLVNTPARIRQLRQIMVRVWMVVVPAGIIGSHLISKS